ncbi:MAG: porphobilinogen synthase [Candidatus Omnitrophica bacterium]|nr:porphobilinogen synthase [Candidatus Omnitrophota bacterium]
MLKNLKIDSLIYPYFVTAGEGQKQAIDLFPGVYRFSSDTLLEEISQIRELGLRRILFFAVTDKKDATGSHADRPNNFFVRAIKEIKDTFPDLSVITDVCLCAYTSHGHCGILKAQSAKGKTQSVLLDQGLTLERLSQIALSHARAGADWVAPSAMAKGQVHAIRAALDKNGYSRTKILGYSAKFASSFYGPFRNACASAPRFANRSSYQLDYQGSRKALQEIADDIKEGADTVMVKPALAYLDVIREAKEKFAFPLAAYNVSAEYVLVKLGAREGLFSERKMVSEIISSIKRAGADYIITYHAKDIAKWLKEN